MKYKILFLSLFVFSYAVLSYAADDVLKDPDPMFAPAPSVPPVSLPEKKEEVSVQDDLWKKHLNHEDQRNEAASSAMTNEQVFHEAGASSISLYYVNNAFSSVNYATANVSAQKFSSIGMNLSYEYYFLRNLEGYGRFGIGPNLGVFWTSFSGAGRKHSYDTIGAVATYEMQLWVAQLIVPQISYGYDRIMQRSYAYAGSNGSLPGTRYSSSYFNFGLSLNLNQLEPKASSKALADTGIKKFYLSYNFQTRMPSDPQKGGGNVQLLGLRFEY